MKTALLHYWMINMRGGENLLAELAEMYPDADIFTHACRPENMSAVFRKHRITESMVGRLPFARRCCQKYLCLMPLALRRWDLSGYVLIISSESGPVKGIRKPRNAYHLCYCHTPMRYLWDMYREYWNCAGPAEKLAMKLFTPYLRNYDLKSAECVDAFLANSEFVRERIRRIYRRDAVVVHPPVDTDFFQAGTGKREDYYLYAGQLTHYKRPDLAVRACCRLKRKLVVAGEGPMKKVLQKLAGGNVTFTGRVSAEELKRLYAGARALLFPGIEDFGIVPVEAQSAGTPVIALRAGGALESVIENETGLFFDTQSPEALAEAILHFESVSWDSALCRRQAGKFSREAFRKNFTLALKRLR